MSESQSRLLILVLVAIALILVSFVAIMLRYASHLNKRNDFEKLRRLHRWLYRIVTLPLVSLLARTVASSQFLDLSDQADRNGDESMAFDWAMRGAAPYFSLAERIHAMSKAARWLRKQGKVQAAQQLEERAYSFKSEWGELKTEKDYALVDAEHARARLCLHIGRFTEMLQIADKIALLPNSISQLHAWQLRTFAYWCMGRYEEAIFEQARIEEKYKESQQSYQSSIFGFFGNISRAIKDSPAPSWENGPILIPIQLYLESGRLGAATEHWERIPHDMLDGETEDSTNSIGAWLAALQGNSTEARRRIELSKTAKTEDEHSNISVNSHIAHAYFALHDYDNAIERLRKLITMNAAYTLFQLEFRVLLARCYEAKENIEVAKSEYELVIAMGYEEAGCTAIARQRLQRLVNYSELPTDRAVL